MAIAFDNASSALAAGVTNFSWTHTATGANIMAAVGTAYRGNAGAAAFSAVAYGAVAMTQKAKIVNDNGGASDISLCVHALANAAAGNIVISVAATLSDNYDAIGVTYTGTNQSSNGGGASTFTAPSGTSPFNLSISTQAGQLVIAFTSDVNNFGPENSTGQTRRGQIIDDGGGLYIIATEKASGGGTTSFSWSASSGLTSRWCGIGFGFSATAAAGVSFVYCMNLLGVGM